MNKEILWVVITAFLVSAGWVSSASAAMKGAPVDYRTCDLRDGKTIEDLNKVTAKFRAYASKSNTEYAAWILFPQYHTDQDYDLAWMGAWPNSESFGVSIEGWKKDGKGLAAEFDQVMDCSSRRMMVASYPINAPAGIPQDGLWLFYGCNLNEGVSVPEAYEAHLEAGQVMKTRGSLSLSWMMVPGMGAARDEPDYYFALAFYRYSDLGSTMEMFINEGGQQARGKILNKVSSCGSPMLLDAVSVRAHDER